jgi:hypothetical protein
MSAVQDLPPKGGEIPEFQQIMGHPRPLWMLFMTEFWERFAFYGIRWALVLYIVTQFYGGEGSGQEPASKLYGAYIALVYAAAIFGGYVADKVLGYQRSILLGNKNADMVKVFAHDPAAQEELRAALDAPSLYDEFLRYLGRRGHAIPADRLERDWTLPHVRDERLIPVLRNIYENTGEHWSEYAMAEQLLDIEQSFQMWRFRHMKTVERIIGFRRGTGGSSGVGFLKQSLELTFFPELLDVRTELGAPAR